MTRNEHFDEAELTARGWHPRRLQWFLGKPAATVPGRGHLYDAADVRVAEADPEWPEQMRLEFEEDDENRRRCATNAARWERVTARRTALYRLFDASGALLYVGITTDPKVRFKNHRSGNGKEEPKPWWPEVANRAIEWFASRKEAEAAEAFAVVTERPRHNKDMTDAWYAAWFRHRWVTDRLREGWHRSGPDAPAQTRSACSRLTAKVEEHRVPYNEWWSPHRPCGRLLAERQADAFRRGWPFHDRSEAVLAADAVARQTRYQRTECERCQQPGPCDIVRSAASQFRDHPQYAPLWA